MAVDMFLKMDGIQGESRGQKHRGEIEILSFSWGVSNAGSMSSGGGGGAGKVNVQDLSIMKQIDSTSPQLMEKCCSGEHTPSATLTLLNREGGQGGQEFLKIKLTDVLVSSFQTGASNNAGMAAMDSVSLNFANVDISATDRQGRWVSQVSCDFGKGNLAHNHD